jgi:protein-disulfide isomerase
MRYVLLPLLVLSGCATTSTSVVSESEPSPVIARYGDRAIRQGEVDARVADDLAKLQDQIFELRAEAAERIALEALVAKKALAAGVPEDEWLAAQVDKDLPAPTEADLRAVFTRVKGRLPPGTTFDDAKDKLVPLAEREVRLKRARTVFEAIKKEAGFELVLKAPEKPRKVVDGSGPSRGNATAKVTIVEFADFECGFCARAHETVQAVLKYYGDQVRLVFRHYPLSFHPKAPKAAEAAACADEQGKFWALHDALFDSQELEVEALKAQAQRAGVDTEKFDDCLDSGRMEALVKRDLAAGAKAGVSGTPAFFINGVLLSGAQPEEAFRKVIDAELARFGK